MSYPDHSIARRLMDDDPDAVGIVMRWISGVLTWPRFWALREDWPDLIQECLTRVVASLQKGHFDASRDFHNYVLGVARHTALQALEESSRQKRSGSPDEGSAPGLAVSEVVAIQQLVRKVMDLASEECRMLMRLYFLEEKGYEEIAREIVLPLGTVKSRLFRCLEGAQKMLRVAVRRHSDDV